MIFSKSYCLTSPDIWQGRIDDEDDPDAYRFHQVVKVVSANELPDCSASPKLSFCLLGFCCDEGVRRNHGRPGAAEGPERIRKELAKLPAGFDKQADLFDIGDIHCVGGDLETAQDVLTELVALILDKGHFPLVIGGGHEIVYGHYRGVRQALTDNREIPPLLVNFDAHLDLRPVNDGGTSGTSFNQIAIEHEEKAWPFDYICIGTQTYANTRSLYKRADELGVHYVDSKDITAATKNLELERILSRIAGHKYIYLTLDFDLLNAANAPGVSSPQPFGMDPEMFIYLVKEIIRTGKVKSLDIAEVSPRYDEDNQTAKLAAVVLYSIINEIIELRIRKPQ